MATRFEQILAKPNLTGDDIGRLYIMERAILHGQRQGGESFQSPTAMYAIGEERMAVLDIEKHRRRFECYAAMTGWIERKFLLSESHLQQAQVQYRTLNMFLLLASFGEDVYRYVAKTRDSLADQKVAEAMDARLEFASLSAFLPGSPYASEHCRIARKARKFLLDSYYFIDGYNFALDRIAELHQLPEVRAYRRDMDILDGHIDDLNYLSKEVYRKLRAGGHPDRELKKRKLQALADYFDVIDPKPSLAGRAGTEKEVDRLVKSFKGFLMDEDRARYRLEALLFNRTAGEAADGR